jgi:hypothetical protein
MVKTNKKKRLLVKKTRKTRKLRKIKGGETYTMNDLDTILRKIKLPELRIVKWKRYIRQFNEAEIQFILHKIKNISESRVNNTKKRELMYRVIFHFEEDDNTSDESKSSSMSLEYTSI